MPSMESWPCYSIEILKSNLYKILCIYFCKICLYKHVYIVKESLKRHIFINTQAYPRKNKTVNPKEINSEYSLERLMLKIQCFGHLMRRANSLEKTLMLGKIEGRGQQRMRWLDGITDSMAMSLFKFMSTESVILSNHLISTTPFSFCLQSFPASGSFSVSVLFELGGQSTGTSASASVLPMNVQGWFPLGLTGFIFL